MLDTSPDPHAIALGHAAAISFWREHSVEGVQAAESDSFAHAHSKREPHSAVHTTAVNASDAGAES
jgi:hypothetical protein